jgi:predicted AAA+ superfamily ATPase
MFERSHLQIIIKRIEEPRRFIQILMGPRQVGKTTLIEVDFVLENKEKVIGLEVKSGTTQSSSGISAFKKAFNPDKVLLIGKSGIPWQDFLKLNPVELF